MIRVGKFEIDVSEPYPIWISVRREGVEIKLIKHDELRDLRYAIDQAMRVARSRLDHPDEI